MGRFRQSFSRLLPSLAVVGAVLVGLALRIAMARGALWLDEAWSAVYAREVGTPLGVLLRAPHDNNHHINTMWLQIVGWGASPMLQRGLSIATGTATIAIAALIGQRRSVAAMIAAAWLFAVSPILVTYGSEARGYAPMLCAVMAAILIVDRWLDGERGTFPTLGMAVVMLLATASQFTALFGLVAISGWMAWAIFPEQGFRRTTTTILRTMGPAILVSTGFLAFILVAAQAAGGFHFGAYDAFNMPGFVHALRNTVVYSFGAARAAWWLLPLALAIGALAIGRTDHRLRFYALAIIAFPVMVAILQLGNSGITRYYLLCSVAALLLTADIVGILWRSGTVPRIAAIALLSTIGIGSAFVDIHLIASLRGNPGDAVTAMHDRAPNGAMVEIDRSRSSAILGAAGASLRYPIDATQEPCPAPRFYFAERDGAQAYPDPPQSCGKVYRRIAGASPYGLSGTGWHLYERVD